MDDSLKRQRMANSSLTEADVRQIKRELREGATPRTLADIYNVGIETIRRINRGESWSWVTVEEPKQVTDEDAEASLQKLLGGLKNE